MTGRWKTSRNLYDANLQINVPISSFVHSPAMVGHWTRSICMPPPSDDTLPLLTITTQAPVYGPMLLNTLHPTPTYATAKTAVQSRGKPAMHCIPRPTKSASSRLPPARTHTETGSLSPPKVRSRIAHRTVTSLITLKTIHACMHARTQYYLPPLAQSH
jgi:hypothetical protein